MNDKNMFKSLMQVLSGTLQLNEDRFRSLFLLLFLTAAFTGCSLESATTKSPESPNQTNSVQLDTANTVTGTLAPEKDSLRQESVISSGDKIQLTVWGYPKFNTTTTVSSNGTITVPLIGEMIIAGLTERQFLGELRQRLGEYVRGSVKLTFSHIGMNDQVSVLGAVSRQGNYPVVTELSLVDVLAEAGGTTTDADLRNIKIFRRGIHSSEVDVDLTQFLRGGNLEYVPRVGPGEVVFVPEQANFIKDFSVYAGEVVFLFGFFALLR